MEDGSEGPARKRRKLSNDEINVPDFPRTLRSSISPPPLRRPTSQERSPKIVNSPFQLTWIQDLPASSNKDAITLKDLLGDPLISECWEFNYLHDIDFLMDAFDPDVKDLVKVHVIHGFWKQDDNSRIRLQTQAAAYKNVSLHTAYMPMMFGTHHSKMLILFRHDSTAQVIIHTANMIAFDWTNMTQAIWKSSLLPLSASSAPSNTPEVIGSGAMFKKDLLNYLKAYDARRTICKPLVEELSKYDFSAIRAALVASVPGTHGIEVDPDRTAWGWAGLQNVLGSVPAQGSEPDVVIQISSIASLGAENKWLDKTFLKALKVSKNQNLSKPSFKIVFPTADEIRRSLNGYDSGSAIHIKIQKKAQLQQLSYLKPMLCHWAGDGKGKKQDDTSEDAGRKRAAPHIKTFIRFCDKTHTTIDWMLVTSSNLSKQAWGEAQTAGGDFKISSYEIGVMVWPELYGENAIMVPTFKTDTPSGHPDAGLTVGVRMAYDLPLVPYGKDDKPWCATANHDEPDWRGLSYKVE